MCPDFLDHLTPIQLVKNCVEKYIGITNFANKIGYSTFISKSVNGFSEVTKAIVASIELATLRKEIIHTTLLAWRNLFSIDQLLHERAWCPYCFQSDIDSSQPVYERLLWKIGVVKFCPIHKCKLVTNCKNCKNFQLNFSTYSFPGYCSRCKCWLGQKKYSRKSEVSLKITKESWITKEMGEILAASPSIKHSYNARRVFASSLKHLIKNTFFTIGEFHRQTHIAKITICNLLAGKMRLSLPVLMKISYFFKCSAVDLLLGNNFNIKYKSIHGEMVKMKIVISQ